MRKAVVVVACVCVAAVSSTAATARTKIPYPSTVEGHVDTVLAPGRVEGTVTAVPEAPPECTGGRRIEVIGEHGHVVAWGRTSADGTYSIRLKKNDAREVLARGRRLTSGHTLRTCQRAQEFIAYYVE